VVCGIEDDTTMFGRIMELIVTPHQECLFVVCPLLTITFQRHYHAYEAVLTDSSVIYNHAQLFDYHPLVGTKAVGRTQSVCVHQVSCIFLNCDPKVI